MLTEQKAVTQQGIEPAQSKNATVPDYVFIIFYFLSGRAQEGLQLAYVVSVDNPTYDQEYQCVTEPGIENTNYSWYRQDWSELPEGVKAEGDRLHFLKETADLNGVYICKVANQYGEAAGSLYYHRINQIKGIHSEL